MLLTIMSSIAQEESRSISENVSWGVQRRFEEGKYSVGYSTFLGYDKGKDGKLVINPEQAKTVRYIFTRFLEGKTPYSIAKELMEKGMKTGAGNEKWSTEGVVRILQNEKYCGNAILQKTYKRDLLSKRVANNGEVRKYLVENGHEAIITWESSRWRSRSLKPGGRKTGSILQSPYSPRSWSAVTAAFSSAPRSGIQPTSTAAWYGSATTSSMLTRSVPLHTPRKV